MSGPRRGALARAAVSAAWLAMWFASPVHGGSGLTWLIAQQNADGSYGGTPASLATPLQSTAEVLRAQQALSQTGGTSFARGLAFVGASTELHAEFLARQIAVGAFAGNPVGASLAALLDLQNDDGGFGDRRLYPSTILSSAFALEALGAAGQPGSQVGGAVGFLLAQQNSNGSWADGANDGSIFLTAQALRALLGYRSTYAGVSAAITAARSFLLSQRGADALWGEDFLSASALLALAPALPDVALVDDSAAALRSRQRADDSWAGDTYTTALCIQSLAAYDSRKSGTPPPASGTIAGYVIKANSTEPIAQATVSITEAPGSSVVTNGDGYYLLPALPSGRYTVTASKTGYAAASAVVAAGPLQASVAPTLVLDLLPQTGLVRGLVFDAATRQPLQDAQLTLQGTSSSSVLSNAAGNFDFGPTPPGSYTLTFARAGYNTLAGVATVVAGQTLTAQVGMTRAGGFLDSSPGTVRGRVVDAKTSQPIAGAILDIGGGLRGSSSADGTFGIPSVPRGTYQGTARASGYQPINFSLAFPAGASGDLGTVALYAVANVQPPTSLTLHVLVSDGVTSAPIAGAAAALVETGAKAATGPDGRFVFAGVALKSFSVSLSAAGYAPATYAIQVSAFGDAEVTLKLSPPGNGATTSTLAGVVTSATTGAAVAGAVVTVAGRSLSSTTGADGRYLLSGIDGLDFKLDFAAVGFQQDTVSLHLGQSGSFSLDRALQPVAGTSFQIVSVAAVQDSWSANATATFTARVASLLAATKSALVLGEVQDATGAPVANVTPYAEGTTTPTAQLAFGAGEVKVLTIPWNTGQLAPGSYKLVLRVVEPGTISRAVPLGRILAEKGGYTRLVATLAVAGGLEIDPPLTQAGLPTPVRFGAVVQNGGNAALPAGTYRLTLVKAGGSSTLFTADAEGPALAVGASAAVAFGSWVPTVAGNFTATVSRKAGDAPGAITGQLYVGDKASGTFTVDRRVVPPGSQTVRGSIAMQGVDTSQGSSTDPLINLVRTSVTKGGSFTAPAAVTWFQSNRCLGCHIQSQSLLGLSTAIGKGDIDRSATKHLYNAIASSQWLDGALRISHPEFAKTQTTLNIWSLGAWPDPAASFRTRYRAAKFLQGVKFRSGNQTSWSPDHASGWWNTDASHTSMTVKAYAGLIRDAARIPPSSVVDYSLGAARSYGSGAVEGMAAGPDGALYLATSAGAIVRLDVATGAVSAAYSGLPSNIQGLAFAADKTLYVTTTAGTLIRFNPDKTRVDRTLGGYLADVAVGPDGLLYFADYNGQRIVKLNASDQLETFASGGLFNYPRSLAFDGAGNLMVANQYGYNILKVAPDKSVSIYAEGLAYSPVRMARAGDGSLYVTTSQPYTNGGIMRVRSDGTIERVLQQEGVLAVGAVGSTLYFANNSDATVRPLLLSPLDTTGLSDLRAEIPFGARFLLSSVSDGNNDNTVHAQRLIGLAESRDMVDSALAAQIDGAVSAEATLLRGRQQADGGWGRYLGYPTDPLVTAMVGIALEYTNPSAADPQIRKAIQYLLNTQRADGSWDNFYNGLSTRLAAASFVMVFMPKALERLGGIDVALRLSVAGNVQLSNPSVVPSTVKSNPDQTTDYTWTLPGVTSTGRQVDFDLILAGMALHEARPATLRAALEFNNSFVDQKILLPLAIPTVRAESQLALAVGIDKPGYRANEPVAISATVSNGGPVAASGQVLLAIRAPGSTAHLVDLPAIPVTSLAAAAQVVLPASWNTGATLAGDYEVHARLLDPNGGLLSESTTPLSISAPAALAASAVSTDKQVYAAWDSVVLNGRAQNVAPNAILAPSFVEVTVASPTGAQLLFATGDVEQLAPNGLRALAFKLRLNDAASGTYPVSLVLKDRFTHAVLSTSRASFEVQRQPIQGLTGQVTVAIRDVDQGDPERCVETTSNLASTMTPGVKLIHRLIATDTATIVDDRLETVDLPAAGQAPAFVRDIDTSPLPLGGYACVLLAQLGDKTRVLASAGFRVLEPPVKLETAMTLGGRGRLLVLLEAPRRRCDDDHDRELRASRRGEHDRELRSSRRDDDDEDDECGENRPGHDATATQRAFLQQMLAADGWSSKIVDGKREFSREFHSGGYVSYALFSSVGRLGESTRRELREAVFRGDGLLVAGARNSRPDTLEDALGVKAIGKVPGATAFVPASAASPIAGPVSVLAGETPLGARLRAASSLAVYQVPARSREEAECDDEHDGDGDRDGPARSERRGSEHSTGDDDHHEGCTARAAVTLNAYGRGQAAFAGVDLLAIATRDGLASAAADDLRTLLHLVQPATVALWPGSVVPVQVRVTNRGIAVPVTLTAPLPPGTQLVDPTTGQVGAGNVTFAFQLDKGAVRTVRYWVRLPPVSGPVTFYSIATASLRARTFDFTGSLTVAVQAPETLAHLRADAEALMRSDPADRRALARADEALRRAMRRGAGWAAIEDGLEATEALLGLTNPRVVGFRVAIDQWLRSAAQPLKF